MIVLSTVFALVGITGVGAASAAPCRCAPQPASCIFGQQC